MVSVPRRCPLGHEWLIWGCSDVPRGGLKADVRWRVERDQKAGRRLRSVTRTIPIEWLEDTSLAVRFIDHAHRLRPDAWHRHADFTFNDRWVHLDLFGGNGAGPGFGFREERIYP